MNPNKAFLIVAILNLDTLLPATTNNDHGNYSMKLMLHHVSWNLYFPKQPRVTTQSHKPKVVPPFYPIKEENQRPSSRRGGGGEKGPLGKDVPQQGCTILLLRHVKAMWGPKQHEPPMTSGSLVRNRVKTCQ